MAYEWMLDVLADLKRFAKANGMRSLATQLEETQLVAANEIAARRAAGERDGGKPAKRGGAKRKPVG